MKVTDVHKRVGIWIRVSTEDQVRGESPEHHERRARLYAEAKGWEVIEVYRLDALSGKTVKNYPETKRMEKDIREGRITGLIFSKLARLARNTKELLEFADFFRECDADLISLAESIDTSTPAGRLFYTMIAAMAQWEREEIAERVALSVPIRAKMGKPLGGQAPFGYRWHEGRLIVDPDEAPVRKLLYELFIEHRRKKTVARLLNERGYRTRGGAAFSDTTVARLIQDPTAKGVRRANYTKSANDKKAWTLKPESEWVLSEVEPVVSEEVWIEANAILDARKGTGKKPARTARHLFAGVAFCHCGRKMYVPSNTPTKYVCQGCRNKIPIEDLEAIFHEELRNFFLAPEEITAHLDAASAAIDTKAELLHSRERDRKKLGAEIDKLYDLYQSGFIDKAGFGAKYSPLAAQLAQIDDELPALQAELDVLRIGHLSHEEIVSEARDLYGRWPELPFDERRRIVEAITEQIVVGVGEVEITLFYAPTSGGRRDDPEGGSDDEGSGGPPPFPQERGNRATKLQGFIAAISWKRAGNCACRAAREIVMRPVSSGSRSASSAGRGNSGSSSRKSTPWWASEISPGRGGEPPPTSATALALWCGAQVGRWPQLASAKRPASEATAADSSASSVSMGGNRPANRCASMDLPEPGGPTISSP